MGKSSNFTLRFLIQLATFDDKIIIVIFGQSWLIIAMVNSPKIIAMVKIHLKWLYPSFFQAMADSFDTRWCPSSLAKLVNISPITMVYGRYNYG